MWNSARFIELHALVIGMSRTGFVGCCNYGHGYGSDCAKWEDSWGDQGSWYTKDSMYDRLLSPDLSWMENVHIDR